jgi:hypothetical protein
VRRHSEDIIKEKEGKQKDNIDDIDEIIEKDSSPYKIL